MALTFVWPWPWPQQKRFCTPPPPDSLMFVQIAPLVLSLCLFPLSVISGAITWSCESITHSAWPLVNILLQKYVIVVLCSSMSSFLCDLCQTLTLSSYFRLFCCLYQHTPISDVPAVLVQLTFSFKYNKNQRFQFVFHILNVNLWIKLEDQNKFKCIFI